MLYSKLCYSFVTNHGFSFLEFRWNSKYDSIIIHTSLKINLFLTSKTIRCWKYRIMNRKKKLSLQICRQCKTRLWFKQLIENETVEVRLKDVKLFDIPGSCLKPCWCYRRLRQTRKRPQSGTFFQRVCGEIDNRQKELLYTFKVHKI